SRRRARTQAAQIASATIARAAIPARTKPGMRSTRSKKSDGFVLFESEGAAAREDEAPGAVVLPGRVALPIARFAPPAVPAFAPFGGPKTTADGPLEVWALSSPGRRAGIPTGKLSLAPPAGEPEPRDPRLIVNPPAPAPTCTAVSPAARST